MFKASKSNNDLNHNAYSKVSADDDVLALLIIVYDSISHSTARKTEALILTDVQSLRVGVGTLDRMCPVLTDNGVT